MREGAIRRNSSQLFSPEKLQFSSESSESTQLGRMTAGKVHRHFTNRMPKGRWVAAWDFPEHSKPRDNR